MWLLLDSKRRTNSSCRRLSHWAFEKWTLLFLFVLAFFVLGWLRCSTSYIGIWCVLYWFSAYFDELLSAVIMLILWKLACGYGRLMWLRLTWTLIAVLDLLYLRYTLRDLVCLVLVFTFTYPLALVGGIYANTLKAGLWYWNVNNASSNSSVNIGARPLILLKYLHIIFLSPCWKLVVMGCFSRFISWKMEFLERVAGKYKNLVTNEWKEKDLFMKK